MRLLPRWLAGWALGLGLLVPHAMAAPSIDPALAEYLASSPLSSVPVVLTYRQQPTSSDINTLRLLGIPGGVVLNRLPMVLTAINKAQLDGLSGRSEILSIYPNYLQELHTNVSRSFIGVTALRKDAEVTKRNGGLPISGQGVGVAIVDTGIDATHPDLQLGQNVKQNVSFPLSDLAVVGNCPAAVASIVGISGVPGVVLDLGFVPPTFVENAPISDAEGGHGTFVSGVVGGTGQASGAFYGGMAPGADLVGLVAGNDCGLPLFGILQAFDYVVVNQFRFKFRVVNNSWGSRLGTGSWDPNHPINVATRNLHDLNITVVFSAGNSGDTAGAINRYSVAPWTISVAASEKEGLGTPASFSSRGQDNGTGTDVAGQPADPNAPPNLRPDLTAPGADIKSTRSKGPGITNVAGTVPVFVGSNDLSTIPPGFLPFYTTSRGTSFSGPHVTGVVALMIQANPLLTPDEVVTLLRQTATPMPYEERVVGAGYLDAHNAVRAAMGLAPVAHPANLFPTPETPEITDPAGDQLGTVAQDIRQGDFHYDATANQLIYRLSLADLSTTTTNMRWTMQSNFGPTTVFVAANVTETGERTFQYGRIFIDANNIRTQETLGAPDAGEINGKQVVIRLGLDKINAAVGSDVLNTVSATTQANAWIRIGTTLTNSLLLNSDQATGRDFSVGEPAPPPPPPPPPQEFCERLAGAMLTSDTGASVPVTIQLPFLDAKLNFHPGNESVTFELFDANGNRVSGANQSNGKRIVLGGLAPGDYTYRLSGTLSNAIDFVVNSCQAPTSE